MQPDRALTEQLIRRNEERLRIALDTGRLGAWELDLATQSMTCTAQCKANFGRPPDAAFSYRDLFDAIVPEDRAGVEAAVRQAIADHCDYEAEYRCRWPDGSTHWIIARGRAHHAPDGTPLGMVGVTRDITERKTAEAALRESEQRFRTMADSAPVMIWTAGPDKLCDWFNQGWLAFAGRTMDQELGMSWAERIHPDDRGQFLVAYEAAFEARRPLEIECRLRRHDGAYRWLFIAASPSFAPDGRFAGFIGSSIDVTERKQAEEANALLAAIVSSSGDAILSVALDGTILSWNASAERLFGYTEAEAVGQSAGLVVPTECAEERATIYAAVRSGRTIEMDTVRLARDGTRIPVSINVAPLRAPGGGIVGLTSIVRDISERKAWEDRQALLNRELSHRVKNSLAVIQAMARHTLRSTPDPQAFSKAFEGRLQALAGAHTLLTEADWLGADLRVLARQQLGPFLGKPGQLGLAGPAVRIPPEAATSLGLVLHELATNAAKYGALSVPHGRVELEWSLEQGAEGDRLRLRWREQGGPPVTPPAREGFGSLLLHNIGAEVVFRFLPAGILCDLALPLRCSDRDVQASRAR